jgi:hypothetical protein
MMSWTLPNGYVVQFNRPRKRGECKRRHRSRGFDGERTVCHDCGAVWRGDHWEANMQPPPARFLVLGRKPGQHGIRPIVSAGDIGDVVVVDSGVMDVELRCNVLQAFEKWKGAT